MAKKGVSMNFQRNHSILMKRIPLHYQKKLTNSSNGSFNTTLMTGAYKNKIRTLLKNNKILAISLQNDRSKIEELLEENKANANIIMFSRLKLATLSDNFKQVVTVLDETLALLQMHSSVCSTKLTPKHTVSREEFKEQVNNVLMDSIPEETKSPQRHSDFADLNKNQNNVSPGFEVDMANQKHESSEKPTNSKRTLQPSIFETNTLQKSDKIDMGTINYGGKNEYGTENTPVYSFNESSPTKKSQLKKVSNRNKNFTSKVNKTKAETKPATSKKYRKVTENAETNLATSKKCRKVAEITPTTSKKCHIVSEKAVTKAFCFNEKNISENSSSSKNNPHGSELHNDFQIFDDIQLPKNKKKNENKTYGAACILKSSVSSNKLHDNIVNNTNFRSKYEKENVSPYKKQKLSARKFKSLDMFKVEPTVTKRTHSRNSALQCLSSKINIENFKSKGETSPIDDLITVKQPNVECWNTSKSYLQDLSLHQQQMVRNLAENTFLVTAEVHRSPEPLKTDKINISKSESGLLKKPIVLVKDIFQHGKSFCKSISYPACDVLNEIPLELQLLEHCSSLKMIPEESNHSIDNSSDHAEEVSKIKSKNNEPPLSVEEEIKQTSQEEKRMMRKRPTSINYKEPPTNIKLRR